MSVGAYKTMLLNAFYDLDAFRQDWIDGFTLYDLVGFGVSLLFGLCVFVLWDYFTGYSK